MLANNVTAEAGRLTLMRMNQFSSPRTSPPTPPSRSEPGLSSFETISSTSGPEGSDLKADWMVLKAQLFEDHSEYF